MEKKYTVNEFLLTYMSWMSMIQRCVYRGNRPDAVLYRDRGITVCDRWRQFENFIEDMGPRPAKGLTLDRFPDKDGNYEPGNCRWADAKQQAANTRSAVRLTFRGESHPIAEWARRLGIERSTIQHRLSQGWDVEKTLTTPMNQENRSYQTWAEGRTKGKKLTAGQVEEIVVRARGGGLTASRLGVEYNVSATMIGKILKQFGVVMPLGRPKK